MIETIRKFIHRAVKIRRGIKFYRGFMHRNRSCDARRDVLGVVEDAG